MPADVVSSPTDFVLKTDQLQLRRMRTTDIAGVMAIESVSFGPHHWSEDSFFNEMHNQTGRYYVLLSNQWVPPPAAKTAAQAVAQNDPADPALPADALPLVVGYCGYWVVLDEVHWTTVAVSPVLRGKALGELLTAHVVERAMGHSARWVTLEVRATNFNAQNLYYKYGFQTLGVRPKYYQDTDEDALIMTTSDIRSSEYRRRFQWNKKRLEERLGTLPPGFGL
ncbi:MAG: ribosomal protein S18-alanine N-acetyltransferase [Candidatus Melainabacteria bacterium]|nr:ribosomal protein S18-alanine N-acetyltransferase [Candidatus Melainabacteria bacterium]